MNLSSSESGLSGLPVHSCVHEKRPEKVRDGVSSDSDFWLTDLAADTDHSEEGWGLLAKGHLERQTRWIPALGQVGASSQKLPQAIVILQMRERCCCWLQPEGRGWNNEFGMI